ncbi:P-loop NTPase fold protein [Streptomyces sp. Li-HN-5-11]|uniref:KAP family P-loop NTPase fold protein n=1 Tax=Streptomyces sp. Li-HN-5-11 TaxID=3075432 RepID=UPI0028B0538C|nr:P-loop NTPase fold protein [Streptomyces sp. Li-HN-5-11]WNM32073.1 P-loop NTPase fold protein [Streptomyces sp. Li-HN-5-11]
MANAGFAPITDNPVVNRNGDRYGFLPHLEVLAHAVEAARPLPLTVGVFGPWGSGKSSFMHMWRDLLGAQAHAVWVNPWKYDQKQEIWAAVITSVLAEIQQNERTRDKATRLARSLAWLSLRGVLSRGAPMVTGGLLGKEEAQQALDRLADSDAEFHRHVNAFERDFAEAVDDYLDGADRLMVFIDDLDRCTPEAAVTVLESLKLFTGDSRCVFVLAMDYDLLSAVAAKKFGELAPLKGAAYLEKIVQLPFFLPEVAWDTLRGSLAPYVLLPPQHAEPFWQLTRTAFGASPRRLKRYVNVFNLAAAILERTSGGPAGNMRLLQLAELLILRSEHRSFYGHLATDPGAWARLKDVAWGRSVPDAAIEAFYLDQPLMRLLSLGRDDQPAGFPVAPDGEETERMMTTVRVTSGAPRV